MKVLIVSPKFHPVIGGGETYVLNSAGLLYQAGVDVSIAVEPNPERNLKKYPFKVYEIEGLSDTKLNIITAPAGLSKLINKVRPNLIHAHGYFALLAVGLANSHTAPILVSIHSTPVWGQRLIGCMDSFDTELTFARNILDLAKPKLLTAANEVYAEAARKVAAGRVKVEVIPYPVDIDFFHRQNNSDLRKKFGLSKKDCLIMTPSRIIERKGIREVVAALDSLPTNFYLCLPAAANPLDKTYWDDICSSQIFQRVKRRLIIPGKEFQYFDMPRLYAACDIVVMPSYYEGAPVATVEAMASGKPFVGADAQGINSLIRHNENGLLTPKKSVPALSAAILRLANDKLLGEKLSQQAFSDITNLSWGIQLPRLINVYKTVIEALPTSRALVTPAYSKAI